MDALVDAAQTTPMKPSAHGPAAAATPVSAAMAAGAAAVAAADTKADDSSNNSSTALPVVTDRPFADATNFAECVRYLNSALATHGFDQLDWPAVCANPMPATGVARDATIAAADSVTAKVNAINTLYRLVVAQQTAVEHRTEQAAKYDALNVRANELNGKLVATANELHAANHKAWAADNKRRAGEVEAKKLEQKLRGQVKELETRNVQIQRRDKQYVHEMRKREKEFQRLQDKVTSLLSDKGTKDAKTWELINTLKAQTAASKQAPNAALHERTVSLYEQRLTELGTENSELRASLKSLQQELQDALNGYVIAPNAPSRTGGATEQKAVASAADTTKAAAGDDAAEAGAAPAGSAAAAAHNAGARVMGLPFKLIQSDVEGAARTKIAALREKMHKLNAAAEEVTSPKNAATTAGAAADLETVAALQRTIAEQQLLIAEQDALLQSALFSTAGPAPATRDTAQLLAESRRWSLMAEAEDDARRRAANKTQNTANAAGLAGSMTPRSTTNATVLAAVTNTTAVGSGTQRLLAQALREAEDPAALVPASPVPASSGALVPPTPQFVYAGVSGAAVGSAALPPPHTPVRRLQFVVTPKKISPPKAQLQAVASAVQPQPAMAEVDENAAPVDPNIVAPAAAVKATVVVDPSGGKPAPVDVDAGASALERMEITSRGVVTTVAVAIDSAADRDA